MKTKLIEEIRKKIKEELKKQLLPKDWDETKVYMYDRKSSYDFHFKGIEIKINIEPIAQAMAKLIEEREKKQERIENELMRKCDELETDLIYVGKNYILKSSVLDYVELDRERIRGLLVSLAEKSRGMTFGCKECQDAIISDFCNTKGIIRRKG